jgi:hypothetical protein
MNKTYLIILTFMKKIVSVASFAVITLLFSSCTFGKTESVQTPVDMKAPVVEVDTTTSGALSNPDLVKEIDEVVSKSLEQAMNNSTPGAIPPAAPTSTDMTTSQTGTSSTTTAPKAGE